MSRIKRPKFHRPHPGWQADLPAPYEQPSLTPRLDRPPNLMTDVVLEVSRRSTRRRGFGVFLSPLLIAVSLSQIFTFVTMLFDEGIALTGEFFFLAVGSTYLIIWATVAMIGHEIAPPRDEPIRFNRVRRQVYVYEFHTSWWNPFFKWHLTTEQYDWNDLRAEVWQLQGKYTSEGVSIAVIQPGTNKVATRFPLSFCEDKGESWAYVCTFMQQGPQALPPVSQFSDPNEASRWDLARRLAPEVRWPADIDAESRSAG